MPAELRRKSQIAMPNESIVKLGLYKSDNPDIFVNDGTSTFNELSVVRAKTAPDESPFDNEGALFCLSGYILQTASKNTINA